MYRISELAQQVGLSRSTLLYYEKLGLITSRRQLNGYRRYSEQDAQRLKLLLQLQAAGLTLKECQACLDAQIDRELLLNRLTVLGEEIEQKQKAKELLASLLGMGSMRPWHQSPMPSCSMLINQLALKQTSATFSSVTFRPHFCSLTPCCIDFQS